MVLQVENECLKYTDMYVIRLKSKFLIWNPKNILSILCFSSGLLWLCILIIMLNMVSWITVHFLLPCLHDLCISLDHAFIHELQLYVNYLIIDLWVWYTKARVCSVYIFIILISYSFPQIVRFTEFRRGCQLEIWDNNLAYSPWLTSFDWLHWVE